ncbi:MAG: hypothetical protein M3245_01635 [Actinomycetota bacterium]|nr:hypothetical protein [Actinomycetota bacterium]
MPSPRSRRLLLAVLAVSGAWVTAAAQTGETAAGFAGSAATTSSLSAATLAPPTWFAASQECVPDGTVGFRAATSATGRGSLTLATPGGVAAGDVLVAQVAIRSSDTPVTAPDAWTPVRQDANPQVVQVVYVRVAVAGEPATHTFTWSGSTRAVGGIAAYTGVSPSVPVDAHAGSSGTGTSMVAPSVTTTTAGTRIVAVFGLRQGTMTSPPEMAERWNVNSSGGAGSVTGALADEAFGGPGQTGSRTAASSNGNFEWVAQLVALRPRSSPRAALTWTPTTSTFADGYRLQRWVGSTQQSEVTLTPRSTAAATDADIVAGTTVAWRLRSFHRSWVSTQASTSLTVQAC